MIRKDVTQKYISDKRFGGWTCDFCRRGREWKAINSKIKNKGWRILSRDAKGHSGDTWICFNCWIDKMSPLFGKQHD